MERHTISWIGRCNIINMSAVPKLIYMFHAVPLKNPSNVFVDIDKIILKFWKGKATRIAEKFLKKIKWEDSIHLISRLT